MPQNESFWNNKGKINRRLMTLHVTTQDILFIYFFSQRQQFYLVLTTYSHTDWLIYGTADAIVNFTAICSGIVSVVVDHIRVPSKQDITVTLIIKHYCPG